MLIEWVSANLFHIWIANYKFCYTISHSKPGVAEEGLLMSFQVSTFAGFFRTDHDPPSVLY
jgi:hypothetical protein